MFFEEAFEPGSVEVHNLARSGRSTKTFIEEKRWDEALALKPDVVFIQFGHNDSHAPEKTESTDAATDYRDYLRRYIDDCRAMGATPILVTPMVRRSFHEDGTLDDNLLPYADAMKAVAKEKGVALIDLHAMSWAFFEPLGPDAAQRYARNSDDRTHFNEAGARVIVGLVAQGLAASDTLLKKQCVSAAAGPAGNATGGLPEKEEILKAMVLANGYFMRQWPTPGDTDRMPGGRPDNIWTRGVYFEGALALYRVNKDKAILNYAEDWGNFHHWKLRGGDRTRNADDQCAGQAYIELYQLDSSKRSRLARIRSNLKNWIREKDLDYYTWIDAMQMSMPCFAKLGVIDKNPDCFEKMYALYDYAKTTLGLYNPVDRLWWRDEKFKPPFATPNGKPCYWSRGNGWVVAAMVRTLEVLPDKDPHYAEYLQMLKDMSAALLPLQREDGFWNVSLADPNDFGGPETTGTALFIYGMAWGINNGHLPSDVYLPAVIKGWNAVSGQALHPNGFLGYVQGTGAEPADGQPVTYDSVPNFDDYGLGCFLLAGSEIYALEPAQK